MSKVLRTVFIPGKGVKLVEVEVPLEVALKEILFRMRPVEGVNSSAPSGRSE